MLCFRKKNLKTALASRHPCVVAACRPPIPRLACLFSFFLFRACQQDGFRSPTSSHAFVVDASRPADRVPQPESVLSVREFSRAVNSFLAKHHGAQLAGLKRISSHKV